MRNLVYGNLMGIGAYHICRLTHRVYRLMPALIIYGNGRNKLISATMKSTTPMKIILPLVAVIIVTAAKVMNRIRWS